MSEKTPVVAAMILCDAVLDDRGTNKKTLVGLFNSIRALSCPCMYPKFFVFVVLTRGSGVHRVELRCLREETGASILRLEGSVSFREGCDIQELVFEFSQVSFPAYGDYSFEFLCDDKPASLRRCSVVRQGAGERSEGGKYN